MKIKMAEKYAKHKRKKSKKKKTNINNLSSNKYGFAKKSI